MNPIIEQLYKTRANYCHELEVSSVYELEKTIESIANEGWDKDDLIDFFESMELYCLEMENGDDNPEQEAIYCFNFESFVNSL